MKYSVIGAPGHLSVTALIDGELHSATQDNPKFLDIVAACKAGTATLDLFNLESVIKKYVSLSPRISIANGHVFFDGDETNSQLANMIVTMYERGEQVRPLVRFMERLATNPNEDSRNQLFDWLVAAGDFCLSDTGMVIGYKSLMSKGDQWFSVHSGNAIVNDVPHIGQIPQKLGDVVRMPRQDVTHDPSNACSVGLHVGTFAHARGFTGDILCSVAFDPRDVVSVPTHDHTKIRVCQYILVDQVSEPYTETVVQFSDLVDSTVIEEVPDEDEFVEIEATDFGDDSSWLARAFWNPDNNALAVTTKGGKTYTHKNVSGVLWDNFRYASSPGAFYNENFKNQ